MRFFFYVISMHNSERKSACQYHVQKTASKTHRVLWQKSASSTDGQMKGKRWWPGFERTMVRRHQSSIVEPRQRGTERIFKNTYRPPRRRKKTEENRLRWWRCREVMNKVDERRETEEEGRFKAWVDCYSFGGWVGKKRWLWFMLGQ